jgi:hypothetical protein
MLRAARRATESIPPGNKSLLKSKFVEGASGPVVAPVDVFVELLSFFGP